jgi:branched-chain amino acid transport system permease protein
VGAVLLVHLPEWFRFLEHYYLIAYSAAMLATVIAAPWGLVGTIERLRAHLFPEPPPPRPQPRLTERRPHNGDRRTLLAVERLGIAFGGIRALDEVSFAVGPGDLVGMIGPNGSGKTTLANVVGGLYAPGHGRLRFAGHDITKARPHAIARLGLARSFQSVNLVDEMTALDNAALGRAMLEGIGFHSALLTGIPDRHLARARAHAAALLEALGVADAAARPAGTLPHGTRRLVEIARALALEPRLLVLDEPAAGLTEAEGAALKQHLRTCARNGLALLVIEHKMSFLLPLVERVICLDQGRVIADGAPAAIKQDARVIAAYLGG